MIPLVKPKPVSFGALALELERIDDSGIFTNYGPANSRFETTLSETCFAGGSCVTVCNATIGLMLAIAAVLPHPRTDRTDRPYALMPSFTFAAAAQAALWNGLTPLFCDSNPFDWAADPAAEDRLIATHGSRIAVIVPYATHGVHIDLDRYEALSARTGIPVVVDAASSLGSLGPDGRQFGTGSRIPAVFSMHATKAFSTAEGGVIHSADPFLVERIRRMANFGFDQPRSASMPGLNAKLSEVHAVLALGKLAGFEAIMRRRRELADRYRDLLPDWTIQGDKGRRAGRALLSVLMPPDAAEHRDAFITRLGEAGIGVGTYFSPHVARHPLFEQYACGPLPVADDLSARVMSLPIWDDMTDIQVAFVCETMNEILGTLGFSRSGGGRMAS